MNNDAGMSDLGEVRNDMPMATSSNDSHDHNKKHYPRTEFTTGQMPSLSDVSVGDKVKLSFIGEIVEVSKGEDWNEDEAVKTRIRVKLLEGSAEKTDSEEDDDKEDENENPTESDKQDKATKNFSKTIGISREQG